MLETANYCPWVYIAKDIVFIFKIIAYDMFTEMGNTVELNSLYKNIRNL